LATSQKTENAMKNEFFVKAELLDLRKIWDYAEHNAMTDLIRFRNRWFCTLLCWYAEVLWVSYYSSHEQKASIYLAIIKLGE
jgi:hypothetical protein